MPSAEELRRLEVRERTTITPGIPRFTGRPPSAKDAAAQALRDQSAIPMQDFDSFRAQFPTLSDSAVAAAREATVASIGTPAASPTPRPPASAGRAVPDDEPPPRVLVSARTWRDASTSANPSSHAAVADVLGDDAGGGDDDDDADLPVPSRLTLLSGSTADDALLDALRHDMLLSLPDGDARRDAAFGLAGEGVARGGIGGAACDDDEFEETVDLSTGGGFAMGALEQRLGGRLAADGLALEEVPTARFDNFVDDEAAAAAADDDDSRPDATASPARDDSSDEESAPDAAAVAAALARGAAALALTNNGDGGAQLGGRTSSTQHDDARPTARVGAAPSNQEELGLTASIGGGAARAARADGGARGMVDRLSNQTGAGDARNQDDALLDEVGARRATLRTRASAQLQARTRGKRGVTCDGLLSPLHRLVALAQFARGAGPPLHAEPIEPVRAPLPISAHERELLQSFLEDLAHDENQRDVREAAQNQLREGSANQSDGGTHITGTPPRAIPNQRPSEQLVNAHDDDGDDGDGGWAVAAAERAAPDVGLSPTATHPNQRPSPERGNWRSVAGLALPQPPLSVTTAGTVLPFVPPALPSALPGTGVADAPTAPAMALAQGTVSAAVRSAGGGADEWSEEVEAFEFDEGFDYENCPLSRPQSREELLQEWLEIKAARDAAMQPR